MTKDNPVAPSCITATDRAITEVEAVLNQLKIARAANCADAYEDALEDAAHFTELALGLINAAPLADGSTNHA